MTGPMALNPAILALLSGTLLVGAYALYASAVGLRISRSWDPRGGSDLQLRLERTTYLVSTIFSYLLAFEFFSLFLFIYTADHIHDLFVGAMCAAGSLNVNDYGYAALCLKVVNAVLCGIWIILNYTDNRGYDYPLIRFKYRFLAFITALLILETILLIRYFLGLRADVLTSCCGTLFSEEAGRITALITGLPPRSTKVVFYLSMALTFRAGIGFLVTGRGIRSFSVLTGCTMILSFAGLISYISPYFYELPTHHCPFCLLQKDYNYVGYPLYLALLGGGITGMGAGIIDRGRENEPLKAVVPLLQRRLAFFSMGCYLLFLVISAYPMIFSDFRP